MIRFVLNGVIAGLVVVAVTEVARRYPRAADVLLAVPLLVFAVYALSASLPPVQPAPRARLENEAE
jgi:hypothetical protein